MYLGKLRQMCDASPHDTIASEFEPPFFVTLVVIESFASIIYFKQRTFVHTELLFEPM